MTTRPRPRSLPSTTTRVNTGMGSLFVTVCLDENGDPFEVFGWFGKGGSFQHGVTELACRLISLHLRRGTPVEEIIDQIGGIQEMQPFFNPVPGGRSVAIMGLGDGIAHVLRAHLKAKEKREAADGIESSRMSRDQYETLNRAWVSLPGRPVSDSQQKKEKTT